MVTHASVTPSVVQKTLKMERYVAAQSADFATVVNVTAPKTGVALLVAAAPV